MKKAVTENRKKPEIWRRFRGWLSRAWQRMHPGPSVRKGAALGIISLIFLIAVGNGIFIRPGFKGIFDPLLGAVLMLLIGGLVGLIAFLVLKLITTLPRFINWLGLIGLFIFVFYLKGFPSAFLPAVLAALVIGLAQAFLGGAFATVFSKRFSGFSVVKKAFIVLALVVPLILDAYLIFWLANRGNNAHLVEKKVEKSLQAELLDAANPSQPGPYEVMSLTYGSGTDKNRPEFCEEADLQTESVDVRPFVKGSKGWRMKLRKWYWDFDFKKFPVNGRVWYPAGAGPFPLVLIVHGNHKMQEFSDPGYAYLGELYASRGFIFVSVDENFFNGAFLSSLSKENDGRGWMLLQHLKVWREWNKTEDNPFFGKVDMNNIGLIGHSRGGEAAAIAGCFNRLSYYPDDATVQFDFNFNIKAIVAIAPSDGQYKPAGKPTPLENVNYLVLQGAHDADVSVFAGMRQYNRVKFTDDRYWFKTSLYSYRSNHGQFNTVWGDNDFGIPLGLILNRKPLLDGEEQRRISKVYITAFLEAALLGKTEYIPLFRNHRLISHWLPDDIYINSFEDSAFRVVANFDEDVDVLSVTLKGARVQANNLAVWREADFGFRTNGTKENNVVYLGWREPETEDSKNENSSYSIELPDNFSNELSLNQDSLLVFSLADADEKPPQPEEDEETEKEINKEENEGEKQNDKEEKDEKEEEKEPLDLSVELVTSDGQIAQIQLSRVMTVPPVLKSRFTKFRNEREWYGKAYEPTLQTYELPLSLFIEDFPDFDPALLKVIRFVFNSNQEGVVIVDNIGFTNN